MKWYGIFNLSEGGYVSPPVHLCFFCRRDYSKTIERVFRETWCKVKARAKKEPVEIWIWTKGRIQKMFHHVIFGQETIAWISILHFLVPVLEKKKRILRYHTCATYRWNNNRVSTQINLITALIHTTEIAINNSSNFFPASNVPLGSITTFHLFFYCILQHLSS